MPEEPPRSHASLPGRDRPETAASDAGVRVRVVLLGTFADYVPRGEKGPTVVLHMPEPVPLRAVRAQLGIPDGTPRIAYRRGDAIDDHEVLYDGDEVSFVSPIAGG